MLLASVFLAMISVKATDRRCQTSLKTCGLKNVIVRCGIKRAYVVQEGQKTDKFEFYMVYADIFYALVLKFSTLPSFLLLIVLCGKLPSRVLSILLKHNWLAQERGEQKRKEEEEEVQLTKK